MKSSREQVVWSEHQTKVRAYVGQRANMNSIWQTFLLFPL